MTPFKPVKVPLADDTETRLLMYIEIQGYKDRNFERRMFVYHHRLYDRYEKDIVNIVVLTDFVSRRSPFSFAYRVLILYIPCSLNQIVWKGLTSAFF